MPVGIAFQFQNTLDTDRGFAIQRGEDVGAPATSDAEVFQEQLAGDPKPAKNSITFFADALPEIKPWSSKGLATVATGA